jgi:ribosomal subunit interface protein
MDVIVTCRHCDLTEEVRELIQRRIDHLERFEPRAHRAEVTLTQLKQGFEAEGLVSVDRSDRVHGRSEATEARTAIDQMAHRLAVQLRRVHSRHHAHKAPPMEELFGPVDPAGADGAEADGAEADRAEADELERGLRTEPE